MQRTPTLHRWLGILFPTAANGNTQHTCIALAPASSVACSLPLTAGSPPLPPTLQLLVGSTSYAIQQQPAYQAAFMRVAGAEELSIGSTAHATAVVHVGGSGLERKGSRGAKAGARAEGGPRAGSQLWEGEGMEEPQQQLRRRHSQGGEPRAGAGHQAPVAAAAGQGAPVGQGRAAQQQQRVRRVRQGQVVPLEDDGS